MKVLKLAKSILKWVLLIAITLIVLLLLFAEGFDRYIATEKGARWLYRNIPNQQLDIKHTSSGVRYLKIGDASKTPLLLIHGAPGSLWDWIGIAKQPSIYDQYQLLIVERPGYGATKPRKAEPSIKIQAERIAEVLVEEDISNAVVAGHSYGAPVAVILGAMIPDRIQHIYALAGQYDPNNEIIFSISHFIKYKIFKYLLPRMIWVSNEEKLGHPSAQEAVMHYYPMVKSPVTIVHGDADTLVPYDNSPFLLKHLTNTSASMITLPNHDHPIHMQIPEYLVQLMMGKEPEMPVKE